MQAVCVPWKINDITKWANLGNNGDRKIKFGVIGGGEGGKHNGVGFVGVSKIFAIPDAFFSLEQHYLESGTPISYARWSACGRVK